MNISEIIVEENFEIIIEEPEIVKEYESETSVLVETMSRLKASTEFTDQIILKNIKDIQNRLEVTVESSQLVQLTEELGENLERIKKSLKETSESISQLKSESSSQIETIESQVGDHLKVENSNSESIKSLESKITTQSEELESISKLLSETTSKIVTDLHTSDSRNDSNLRGAIDQLNDKIARIAQKHRQTVSETFDELIEVFERRVSSQTEELHAVRDDLSESIKEIGAELETKLSKTELSEMERFLDLHIGQILEESNTTKESLTILEANVDSLNKVLIEKIDSADVNSRTKTRELNASLKKILEANIEALKRRVDAGDEKLSRFIDENSKKPADKTLLIENVTTKISEQYNFKLGQIKKSLNEKLEKFEGILEGVKKEIRTKSPNVEIKIDRKVLNSAIEDYLDSMNFNSTPEHKLEGGFLFFKQPDGRWGHGIRIDYSHLVSGGGVSMQTMTVESDGVVLNEFVNRIDFTGDVETSVDHSTGKITVDFVGGGGGSLSIYDEGVLVDNRATKLNFVGADVTAFKNFGTGRVDVYIPSPQFSDFFNSGTAVISGIVGTQRNISAPGQFSIGDWTTGTQHPCINSSSLSYSTPTKYSVESLESIVGCQVINANGIVVAQHTVSTDSNSDTTQNGIRIVNSEFGQEAMRYCIKTNFTIDLNQIFPSGGRFRVRLFNTNENIGNYEFAQSDLFYDRQENSAAVSGVHLSVSSETSRFLSGVKFFTTGTKFGIVIDDCDWLNDKSYPTTQIEAVGSELGLSQLNIGGTNLTGWTSAWNDTNSSYTNSDWTLATSNLFVQSSTANASVRTIDWTAGSWVNSNDLSLLIDTFSDNSTRTYEDFRNESRRLTSDLVTAWDSQQNLGSYDDNLGLQVKNSRLIYPTENFQIYQPGLLSQPNYIGLTGKRTFYRRMWSSGASFSNGTLTFTGTNISEANFPSKMDVQWSIDKTDWFRIDTAYEGGVIAPNGGSRVNADSINLTNATKQLAFTMGESKFSSEIWFRFSLSDSTVSVDSVSLNWT